MTEPPTTVQPFANTDPELAYDGDARPEWRVEPLLSITLPVWSRTPELADDGAAHHRADLGGRAHPDRGRRRRQRLAVRGAASRRRCTATRRTRASRPVGTPASACRRAPMVVVLNSDCRVEPGWDVALYEAASDGRRVAFPYTDHCDGLGLHAARPGRHRGLVLHARRSELYDEVGVFDEWFNPAFCEDTDYWHRAWQMGVELSPVPAAHVVHARRTTASTDAAASTCCCRGTGTSTAGSTASIRTGAPPYYNREIVDYVGYVPSPRRRAPTRADRRACSASVSTRPGRPRCTRRWRCSATRACTGAARRCAGSSRSRSTPASPCSPGSIPASTPSPTSRRCR